MNATERRRRFRQHLAGERCLHPGSVYDPISGRIAEDLGFEMGMFAGSVASMTVLGAPDLIVLTLTEFADQARRICRATRTLPLLVDADHGYGNALGAKRTVEELETAGIAALTIEDTVLPRPYGETAPRLTSIDEGVGRLKAALAGRSDPELVVIGRTSAPAVSGIEDTLARARAYEAAGVDALFFVGMEKRAELEAVRGAVKLPIVLNLAVGELKDTGYLASQGVRICLQGHTPFMASVQAAHDTLKALREGTPPAELKGVASADLMKKVTRDSDYTNWTRDFLKG